MQRTIFSLRTAEDIAQLPPPTGEPGLLLLFGVSKLEVAAPLIERVVERYPNALAAGCSTAGEIIDDTVVDDTLSGALITFSRTELASASAAVGGPEDSFGAGWSIAPASRSPRFTWRLRAVRWPERQRQ